MSFNSTKFLSNLLHAGVQLWSEQGQLNYRAPKGSLDGFRAELVEHKQEIIPLLGEMKKYSLLSFSQQRLWFLTQLEPSSVAYNQPAAYRLTGPLRAELIERSINEIVKRHEILRTVFLEIEGQPFQVVLPELKLELPLIDLSEVTEADRDEEIRRLSTLETAQPFDLTCGPLLRFRLLRLSDEEHVLLRIAHHIIIDGWSSIVLIRELAALYQSFVQGQPSALTELPLQYSTYAVLQREWLSGRALDEHLDYWKQQLGEVPPALELPTDHPRPRLQGFHGAQERVELDSDLSHELKRLSQKEGVTLFMTLLAAFQLLLSRYTGQDDIVVGSPVANRNRAELSNSIGFFVNTLVLRTSFSGNPTFRQLLERVRETTLGAYAHQELPFEMLVEQLKVERNLSHSPLFQVMFAIQNMPVGKLTLPGLTVEPFLLESISSKFDLTLSLFEKHDGLIGALEYNTDLFDHSTSRRLVKHFKNLLAQIVADPDRSISELAILSQDERDQILIEFNNTETEFPETLCIDQLWEAQAQRTPDAPAVIFNDEQLSYRQLDQRSDALAAYLRSRGVGPEVRVAICMEPSSEMVVALLGILKAGAAYLPLDPTYPKKRLSFMLEDARVRVLLTQKRLGDRLPHESVETILVDEHWSLIESGPRSETLRETSPDNAAYVIYTSGSTGAPKAVVVTHRNVFNFFTAMNAKLGTEELKTWLAVTNITFDISVLELLWPLTQGHKVVIHPAHEIVAGDANSKFYFADKKLDFSLFYFAADENANSSDKYRLLLDGAKFADEHGFAAVWTPERHFHSFGGLYPNPSVVSAAIAATTKHIQIRAGSVVLPLHNPVRVAEEWSVVDNLSNGRVGLSFASGWHANDFVLLPENYDDRKNVMERDIETVCRLWRGETVTLLDGAHKEFAVKIHPQPLQPELPFWITAAGNPETFKLAGKLGANLLTHLLSQSIEELSVKINLYREAWREHGHPGDGYVTLMVHTFVDDNPDYVREKVKQPFTDYLRTSFDLMRNLARTMGHDIDSKDFNEAQMDRLLAHAFERYFETSGLFGTPNHCLRLVDQLKGIGVDEIGCLIDFGIDHDAVMSSLHYLDVVRQRSLKHDSANNFSFAAQVDRHEVTHLQCTPSLAKIILAQPEATAALGKVETLMLGGEALPVSLASELREKTSARILNMYGPTETTIWSTTHHVNEFRNTIPIGQPIANTQVYILDRLMRPVPIGVYGELLIGGEGVTRGYLNAPQLTAERFVPDPFSRNAGARLYKTGDLARYLPDGSIEFRRRMDQQVKLRGFRVELGEIEAVLASHDAITEAAVVAATDAGGNLRLTAYYVPRDDSPLKTSDLRSFLAEYLPDHMVPAVYVSLNSFPLTPNGKLDRLALPAQATPRPMLEATYVMPGTEAERIIAGIWQEVLEVEKVGINDNFFDLGGHSLLVVQIHRKLEETFKRKLPLFELFKYPTVYSLAQHLTRDDNGMEKKRDQAQTRNAQRSTVKQQRQFRRAFRTTKLAQEQAV